MAWLAFPLGNLAPPTTYSAHVTTSHDHAGKFCTTSAIGGIAVARLRG